MKKNILLAVLPFVLLLLSAGNDPKLPKLKSATVAINGTQIMIDQGEVSMADWFTFIYKTAYDEKNDGFNQVRYDSLMPDTNILPQKYRFLVRMFAKLDNFYGNGGTDKWRWFFGDNTYTLGFFIPVSESVWGVDSLKTKIKNYMKLPVVAITYSQAQEYIAWRAQLASAEKKVADDGWKVKGRLMTKEEWQNMATSLGPRFATNNTAQIDTVNTKGCYLLNIRTDKPCESVLEGRKVFGEGAVGVFSYNPDRNGLYNIFGNVAEMTQEEGIAIGGSYADYGIMCNASKTVSYSKPEPWLGFRCVFEFSR
ncbi:MAG TPA: SUMF1/EgtB/PvdO family nonheme iron enzyme [Bacteroidia bacterium]|nr:SUMF1/EgtB/PvdO family nonheme iron enzyme [Bacteroidia bacterium]